MTSEELNAIFFAECEESLASAEAGLVQCQTGNHDAETINGVFRAVHSVKGGAGAFGFVALQEFAHHFETLLAEVREGRLEATGDLLELLIRALDLLTDHVAAARGEGVAPADEAVIAEMQKHLGGEPAPKKDAEQAAPPVAEAAETGEDQDDDEQPVSADDLGALLDDLGLDSSPAAKTDAATAERPGITKGEQDEWLLSIRPHRGAMDNGGEPILMLREFGQLGGRMIAVDTTALPGLDQLDPSCGYLGWTFSFPAAVAEADVQDIVEFLDSEITCAFHSEMIPPVEEGIAGKAPVSEPVAESKPEQKAAPAAASKPSAQATPAAAPPAAAAAVQTIRIDLLKLDRLVDAVGELTIAQAMLAQSVIDTGDQDLAERLAVLETLTRDIQESAMSIRAQPIGSVFSRVPRILRDLAGETGKHVKLQLSGEGTELDKTVIERLGEPLTHLIRNAVDHGIEGPEDRLAAGKSVEGTLSLSAEQRSGHILISISDDGRGIDREKVLEKARKQGLVDPSAELSGEDIDQLIFAPGFSTAQTVSNVSGRGVGMDVVRQNVKDLGGRIVIKSELGKGTTFTLALPLTLAIAEGMIVRHGADTYVVPLGHVVESLRPTREMIEGFGCGREMLNMRGEMLSILRLDEIFHGNAASDPCEGVVIVVETEKLGRAALVVDEIRDQRQVVIKSVEQNIGRVPCVAGATILGDGKVALILDIEAVAAHGSHTSANPMSEAA